MTKKCGQRKSIGILNQGKDNSFIDNEFHGFDIGIHDKGKRTLASGNKFFEKIKDAGVWRKDFWFPLLVAVISGLIVYYLTN